MQATAIANHIRISPRKVKLVLDIIRNQPADKALAILKYTPKAACEVLEKLLKSAIANAENNKGMNRSDLYVAEAYACPGPTMKRLNIRARGRADRMLKRTSHITIILDSKEAK